MNKTQSKFYPQFMRLLVLLTLLALAFAGAYAFKKVQKHKKKIGYLTNININKLASKLPKATSELTQTKAYGENGIFLASNLYFDNENFVMVDSSETAPETFLTNSKYSYDVNKVNKTEFSTNFSQKNTLKLEGTTLLFCSSDRMKKMLPHYFHFMEELILAWAAYKDLEPAQVKTIVFLDKEHWMGINKINLQILSSLFPEATILNKSQFKKLSNKSLVQFENAITIDRQGCHENQDALHFNKMAIGHQNLIKKEYLNDLRDRVLDTLKTSKEEKDAPVITYVQRKGGRYFTEEFEQVFTSKMKELFPNHKFQIARFEKYTYPEQLQMIRNTDILVGLHGNGLTHAYFLPNDSLVVEIFPEGAFAMDYQLISELCGHNYFAIDAAHGIISQSGNHMPPRGNVNQIIPSLDMDSLASVISDPKKDALGIRKEALIEHSLETVPEDVQKETSSNE